ncbi:CRISPR-associated helicase Cas3' [Exiguobacterium sp. s6]|uniref:CRISPR-associated helicase Cas3' n=1 Tax=Exiguobacterium sp. s6 TaxID=2751236 RepID=UPI001BEAEB65
MQYIAHIRAEDGEIQSVRQHLLDTKLLAEKWGDPLGISKVCGLAALLHDMGKYSEAFQHYIRRAVSGEKVRRGEVDHATAGGRLLFETLKRKMPEQLLGEIVSNAIISHHGNLHDYIQGEDSPFLRRVELKVLDEYEVCKKRFFDEVISEPDFINYAEAASQQLMSYLERIGQTLVNSTFLTKLVFSILIDADRTNTRQFEEKGGDSSLVADLQVLKENLERHLSSLKDNRSTVSTINVLRQQMSEQCMQYAERPSGVYTLSIPTGGGKTLASLRYALHHASHHQKKRIIYVVPFTTIIEQNAQVARAVLNTEEIVEHHSNVIQLDDASEDEMSLQAKLNLAKDNWDAPIIFTTMVQYLNTFYAKGNRNTRRLHHLSEAVVIFDEVQKVPTKCVSLFNESLNFLKDGLSSSVILCTATQPALDFVKHRLTSDGEMIQELPTVIEAFKRTEIEVVPDGFDTHRLDLFVRDKANVHQSVLIILNTKTVVRKLYESLKPSFSEDEVYHLSTSMCPAHRKIILQKINQRLKSGERVICISTQLIEAGVDVSFQCVIRSFAGLDSIAQAAGRCNRHGEVDKRTVYLIDHVEESVSKLTDIAKGQEIVKRLVVDLERDSNAYGGELLSQLAMQRYFQEFYQLREVDLDYPIKGSTSESLAPMLFKGVTNQHQVSDTPLLLVARHRTVADNFHVIDQQTDDVLAPYGDKGEELIALLNGDINWEDARKWLKESQQYTISIYNHERQALEQSGGIVSLLDGRLLALQPTAYDEQYGLNLSQDSEMQNLFM